MIIPLFKKGIKTVPQNYRPISLTSHIIKIFERIVRKNLAFYFEHNNLFNHNQHGFRSNRSCSTQLITHVNNILTNAINQQDTDCIYVDYSKAFDKIDHDILLSKLNYYGLSNKYLHWIKNFLNDRVQTVYLNNHFSYPTPVLSGVPQGSVLGPLLFIIYINDLPEVISHAQVLTFADDTKLVSQISNSNDVYNLQEDLNNLINWSNMNNMKLNDQKFELLCHKLNSENQNQTFSKELPFNNLFFSYTVSNFIDISPSLFVRDLGILIDNKLQWDTHIQNVTKKARQVCGWILSVFYTRDSATMLTLFNSLVRSKIEYGSEIWNPHLNKHIIQIENIQRSFTNRISGTGTLNYWERLDFLKIMSLQRRRERILIINIWKIKNNIIPNTINLTFKLNQRANAIRAVLKPLPKIKGRILTCYEESFLINAPKLWNLLPGPLTQIDSLPIFKTALNTFLSKIPDKPPIPGYPFSSNNSLKEQCLGLNLNSI